MAHRINTSLSISTVLSVLDLKTETYKNFRGTISKVDSVVEITLRPSRHAHSSAWYSSFLEEAKRKAPNADHYDIDLACAPEELQSLREAKKVVITLHVPSSAFVPPASLDRVHTIAIHVLALFVRKEWPNNDVLAQSNFLVHIGDTAHHQVTKLLDPQNLIYTTGEKVPGVTLDPI